MKNIHLLLISLFACISCQTETQIPPPAPPAMKPPHDSNDTDFSGLPQAEAESLAKSRGLTSRVVEVDGVPRAATKDYRPNRVNFVIESGKVKSSRRG